MFVLNKNWAVSTDQSNWILQHKNDGKEVWVSVGYYATPESLISALYRKVQRADSGERELAAHLRAQLTLAEQLTSDFRSYLMADKINP